MSRNINKPSPRSPMVLPSLGSYGKIVWPACPTCGKNNKVNVSLGPEWPQKTGEYTCTNDMTRWSAPVILEAAKVRESKLPALTDIHMTEAEKAEAVELGAQRKRDQLERNRLYDDHSYGRHQHLRYLECEACLIASNLDTRHQGRLATEWLAQVFIAPAIPLALREPFTAQSFRKDTE